MDFFSLSSSFASNIVLDEWRYTKISRAKLREEFTNPPQSVLASHHLLYASLVLKAKMMDRTVPNTAMEGSSTVGLEMCSTSLNHHVIRDKDTMYTRYAQFFLIRNVIGTFLNTIMLQIKGILLTKLK